MTLTKWFLSFMFAATVLPAFADVYNEEPEMPPIEDEFEPPVYEEEEVESPDVYQQQQQQQNITIYNQNNIVVVPQFIPQQNYICMMPCLPPPIFLPPRRIFVPAPYPPQYLPYPGPYHRPHHRGRHRWRQGQLQSGIAPVSLNVCKVTLANNKMFELVNAQGVVLFADDSSKGEANAEIMKNYYEANGVCEKVFAAKDSVEL